MGVPSPAPVRIAIVVDSDAFGGAEVYARQFLHRLPSWFHRSLVVSEPVAGYFPASPAMDRVVVPLARRAARAPALAAALEKLRPDVVHVNLVDPDSNRASLVAAAAHAPTVVTLHLTGGVGPDPRGLRADYRRVAHAIAPSGEIADQLGTGLGVPAQRVVRIRHGVDLPATPVQAARRDTVLIGAVGRLTPQKGFDLLMEAVVRLAPRRPQLRVVVVGEGRERPRLERQARGLPVSFPGFRPDVSRMLRGMDVFCLPSRREALSLALLEAMAHGLPCVTTDVGDAAAEVRGAALIVPPEDTTGLTAALDLLIGDPRLRKVLGRLARRRALRAFDAQRMVDETAAVLHRAARGQWRAARQPVSARG